MPFEGQVAQSAEHAAENRGVAGSIPALATRLKICIRGVRPIPGIYESG